MHNKSTITAWFMNLQNQICEALEQTDGKGKFIEDNWQRKEGGGGRTRIIQDGNIIEKGGVAFSAVHGEMPEVLQKGKDFHAGEFYATGVSIVIHPKSPKVPIIHMNVRYFENNETFWFGGGIDLTPHYIDKTDAKFFHQQLKNTCDKFHPNYYPEFKKWADDYFYIKHRHETRGVGGIFFDRLSANEEFTLDDRFKFVQAVGETFAPTYTQLMQKNKDLPYNKQEIEWQQLRRGRYVEFNLVYDAGTKFGLETGGRIESILMSLPKLAGWAYNFQTKANSPEEQTLQLLKKGIDWV